MSLHLFHISGQVHQVFAPPLDPDIGFSVRLGTLGAGKNHTARPTTGNCAWHKEVGEGDSRAEPVAEYHATSRRNRRLIPFFLPPERAESPLDSFPADKENGALVSSSFLLAIRKKTSNKVGERYSINILKNAVIFASSVTKLVD